MGTSASDIDERIRLSFADQATMQLLGVTVRGVHPGEVILEMPFDSRLTQQNGFLHAGMSATVLDTAAGYAALTLMPLGADVLTVEFKVNLLRPARGTAFRASARVIKPGRTLMVTEAHLTATEAPDRPLALLNATMMVIPDPEGSRQAAAN